MSGSCLCSYSIRETLYPLCPCSSLLLSHWPVAGCYVVNITHSLSLNQWKIYPRLGLDLKFRTVKLSWKNELRKKGADYGLMNLSWLLECLFNSNEFPTNRAKCRNRKNISMYIVYFRNMENLFKAGKNRKYYKSKCFIDWG